jgi:hypothetical protein
MINGKFEKMSQNIGMPDDMTFGYLIEVILNIKLTNNQLFHSHLEDLNQINKFNVKEQITLSYNLNLNNFVNLNTNSSLTLNRNRSSLDVTKFISIHCHLYPIQCYF